jgi:hypothetical protein
MKRIEWLTRQVETAAGDLFAREVDPNRIIGDIDSRTQCANPSWPPRAPCPEQLKYSFGPIASHARNL